MNKLFESLVKKYPNDAELGKELRKMFNEHKEDFEKIRELNFQKGSAAGRQEFEVAANERAKEKKILDKIKEKFAL